MDQLNFIKLKKVTITKGKNVQIKINKPKALDKFLAERIIITCNKTRDLVVRLDRLSQEEIELSCK